MIKLIRQLFRSLVFLLFLMLCFSTAACLQVLDKLTGKYHTRAHFAKRYLIWLCAVIGFRINISGSTTNEACLVVSNHISWTDIPVLGSIIPVYFLSKAEVRGWPVIGRLAQEAGTLFINRGDGKSGRVKTTIEDTLAQGNNVLIFPEGTTTNGSSVLKFHPKLINASKKHRTAIQPITIKYSNQHGERCDIAPYIGDDSFPTHIWRIFAQPKIYVDVCLHPTIEISDETNIEELTIAIKKQIEEKLAPLTQEGIAKGKKG